MNEQQNDELLELQRKMLKEQVTIRKELRVSGGCLILFLIFFLLFCLARL